MSYAKISKEKVVAACENYLARRKARIEREQEDMIQEEMKPRWWRKARSREVALQILNGNIWNEYNMIAMSGVYWAREVEELLSLARATDSEVIVKAEMARILFKEKK